MISAVDVKSAAAIVTRAKQAKIPVISYGRLIANADLDYYVSIDPFKVGQQQGQALLDALKGAGKTSPSVVMINGAPTDSNAAPYKKGAHSVLDPAGVKIVEEFDTPDWSPDKAQQEMEQAITSLGRPASTASTSPTTAWPAGRSRRSRARHRPRQPLRHRPGRRGRRAPAHPRRRAADDRLPADHEDRRDGGRAGRAARAGQDAAGDRHGAVDNGREDVPSVLLDTIAITKDNIADTVVKDGFVKPSQLCTAKYASACEQAGIT